MWPNRTLLSRDCDRLKPIRTQVAVAHNPGHLFNDDDPASKDVLPHHLARIRSESVFFAPGMYTRLLTSHSWMLWESKSRRFQDAESQLDCNVLP